MATDTYIAPPPNSTGEKVDVEQVTVGANSVDRQRIIHVPGEKPYGCSIYHVVSAGSDNAGNIKAAPGQVYGWNIFNNAEYPVYVKFHNDDGTPTAGADVVHTVGIQAGIARESVHPFGLAFDTGIAITIVKGIADADNTAVVAADCVVDIYYK